MKPPDRFRGFDHAAMAGALRDLDRKDEALREYEAVIGHVPVSPHQAWAVIAAGNLLLEAGSGEAALRLVSKYAKQLPPAPGSYLYGAALEAAGRAAAIGPGSAPRPRHHR